MKESQLRAWFKKIWGDIEWVEFGPGGTPGIPDTTIVFDGVPIGVELKVWKETRSGVECKVRPAQIRYHKMAAKEGKKTAFLVGLPGNEIAVFDGKYVPEAPYGHTPSMIFVKNREDVERALRLLVLTDWKE